MDCRIGDLRYKEVINVNTGLRLGYVSDGIFDVKTGRMRALVVPGGYRVMGFLGRNDDYVIPWEAIRRIGDDIILVEDSRLETRERKRKRWPETAAPCPERREKEPPRQEGEKSTYS